MNRHRSRSTLNGGQDNFTHLKMIVSACLILILGLLVKALGLTSPFQSYFSNNPPRRDELKCQLELKSNVTRCRPKCNGEQFSLFGKNECHPWLDCNAIKVDVQITDLVIGTGAVKLVKLGKWKGNDVSVSFLRDERYKEDFLFNIEMHRMFGNDTDGASDQVVQLIGFCLETPVLITEYHPLGSGERITDIFKEHLPMMDSLMMRFSLGLDFVRAISMLHGHPNGTRVFCDANDPEKALSQFLLSSDLHLLLNDMDALPLVNEKEENLVKCGHKELYGEFVAPEQLWPYEGLPFDDSMMPGYTEKVDIWKIPDIFNYLLNNVAGSNKLKLYFFNIHSKCKSTPNLRPSAREVLHEYKLYYKTHYASSTETVDYDVT